MSKTASRFGGSRRSSIRPSLILHEKYFRLKNSLLHLYLIEQRCRSAAPKSEKMALRRSCNTCFIGRGLSPNTFLFCSPICGWQLAVKKKIFFLCILYSLFDMVPCLSKVHQEPKDTRGCVLIRRLLQGLDTLVVECVVVVALKLLELQGDRVLCLWR